MCAKRAIPSESSSRGPDDDLVESGGSGNGPELPDSRNFDPVPSLPPSLPRQIGMQGPATEGTRKNDTCLMQLKADPSRDRLSFRAPPRAERSVAIVCNINSSALRWGENSILPTYSYPRVRACRFGPSGRRYFARFSCRTYAVSSANVSCFSPSLPPSKFDQDGISRR